MGAKRTCIKHPLSKQPLALVLIQLKFSPIANIKEYVTKIQDEFRIIGYSDYQEQQSISFTVTPDGINCKTDSQWFFSTPEKETNIILDSNQVLFQTSFYDFFEKFYDRFQKILNIVMDITQYKENGHCLRYGLRYVDQIYPIDDSDTIDSYLHKGMIIEQPEIFQDTRKICNSSVAGKIHLKNNKEGMLLIRIIQGEKGLYLPPDLIQKAPKLKRTLKKNDSIGMIDMDAFYAPKTPEKYDSEEIERIFYKLHDFIIEAFFKSVVSQEGIKKWA